MLNPYVFVTRLTAWKKKSTGINTLDRTDILLLFCVPPHMGDTPEKNIVLFLNCILVL